jgi:hypothetical protein
MLPSPAFRSRARSPQIVRARFSSLAFAFATIPWKYPPGDDRKCPAGLADTIATAIAASSRPIAGQASPHRDFDTPSSPRSQSAAGVGQFEVLRNTFLPVMR